MWFWLAACSAHCTTCTWDSATATTTCTTCENGWYAAVDGTCRSQCHQETVLKAIYFSITFHIRCSLHSFKLTWKTLKAWNSKRWMPTYSGVARFWGALVQQCVRGPQFGGTKGRRPKTEGLRAEVWLQGNGALPTSHGPAVACKALQLGLWRRLLMLFVFSDQSGDLSCYGKSRVHNVCALYSEFLSN